jgi:hypothetical protein
MDPRKRKRSKSQKASGRSSSCTNPTAPACARSWAPSPPMISFTSRCASSPMQDQGAYLRYQAHPQQFVRRAINRVRAGKPPSDENALEVRRTPPFAPARPNILHFELDLDCVPRLRAQQEVHEPQLRHHLAPRRARQRRCRLLGPGPSHRQHYTEWKHRWVS